ncbi:MAG: M13 family metallopeptidase [Lachnospiraceae bacterium]|nr:M13 family metallopeptidase [Lachnospiraceae bacterium]
MLALDLTACTAADELQSGDVKWIDSDLEDVRVDDEVRLQDDFAAAVNREWKLEQDYAPALDDIYDVVLTKKKQIVTDESIEGCEAELLREYYELATDWEARDRDGVLPLKAYTDEIAACGNMAELFDWMTDPDRNPLALAPLYFGPGQLARSEVYEDRYAVYLTLPELSLDEEQDGNHTYYYSLGADSIERLEAVDDTVRYFLGRLGYGEKEAKRILHDCFSFERLMADADDPELTKDEEELTFDREELTLLAGDYPVTEYLDGLGLGDNDIFVASPGYVKKLDRICAGSNLEKAKAYFIVGYILKSHDYLDREALDKTEGFFESRMYAESDTESSGMTEEDRLDGLVFEEYIGQTGMVGAMNRVYVENFFDDSTITELNDVTHEIIDGYKVIFNEEEWLTDEGKKKCMEKLDAITVHIAYQDFDTVSYEDMQLKDRAEGGNFLEAYYEASRFMLSHYAWISMTDYDRNYWDPLDPELSTTITNAMYDASSNGIYIFAGICEAPAYSPEMSFEEKLAGIFTIVGHEITHGFDKTGAQYDKNGENESWLPYEDQTAFNDRNDLVADYYSSLSPFESSGIYDGSRVSGEATADMGGIKVTLYLGSKEPDFDYDAYFRAYAGLWRANVPFEEEQSDFLNDEHPLAFYRINVGVQQFDEFYETYDVAEGDGMYLEPDKRISVW